MTLIVLTIGLIAFVGGAVMRRRQMKTGPAGLEKPTNGFAGAGVLIGDYFRILPLGLVGFGALMILSSVFWITFSLMVL